MEPSTAQLDFSDQIVLRDLVLRAEIHEQSVNVCLAATLSAHLTRAAQTHACTRVDHSWLTRTIEHVTRTARAISLESLAEEIAATLLSKLGNVPCVTLTLTMPTALAQAEVHVTRTKVIVPPYAFDAVPYVLEDIAIYGHETPEPSAQEARTKHRAILGMGSNINDRVETINRALELLAQCGTIISISFLYESPAKYVTNQPDFLNLCLIIDTDLSAMALLRNIKSIEEQLGRPPVPLTARNGPRAIDIDILYYDHAVISKSVLVVPHPSIYERDFVLRPLADVAASYRDPVKQLTIAELWANYSRTEPVQLRQVTPVTWKTKLGNTQRAMWCVHDYSTAEFRVPGATKLVGVLNVTSDSFSGDGLAKNSTDMREVTAAAVALARDHVMGGASLLEVGGESSRPGSEPVPSELELTRVTQVIAALRAEDSLDHVPVIVDTTKSEVARAALDCGASLLNDVSGSASDAMLALARDRQVPIVLQHSRGTPKTMARDTDYGVSDEHVIEEVARELRRSIERALALGVRPWLIVTDPGLGFAKTPAQSLAILRHLSRWRALIGGYPLYIGPSRKGFVGHVTGRTEPAQRVWGSAGAVSASIAGGAQFVRVHDLPQMYDVARVSDAIFNAK